MTRIARCVPPIRPARLARLAVVGAIALGLAACSMADSRALLETGSKGCHSDLGAYFLPRDVLHVEVRHTNPVRPSDQEPESAARRQMPRHEIALIEVRTLPDRRRGFCLDYLASRMSHDYLEAKRTNGVIQRISTSNRAYSENGASWTNAPTGGAIETEDVTSEILAQKLIAESFNKFSGATYRENSVDQPWMNGTSVREAGGQAYGAGTADPADNKLFCDLSDAEKTSNDVLKKQRLYSIDRDLCASPDGAKDRDGGVAPRRPHFTPPPGAAGRDAAYRNVENLRAAAFPMRRLVYQSRRNTPYKPSGTRLNGAGTVADTTAVDNLKNNAKTTYEHNNLWTTDTAFSADFDPARPGEAAVNNSGLKDFGYCLILNDGIVDLADRDRYCDDPLGYARRKGWHAHGPERFEGYVAYEEGILYRPRLNYTLYVFKKRDRKMPGGWMLDGQHIVSLSNLSPLISVGVKRTLFASRNTIVEFDRGALVNIAVKKDSELLYGLDVPLALVKKVGELPTNIVKIRIRNTDALKDLTIKQRELLEAEKDYVDAVYRMRQLEGAVAGGGQGLNVPTSPGGSKVP